MKNEKWKMKNEKWKMKSIASECSQLGMWVKNEKWTVNSKVVWANRKVKNLTLYLNKEDSSEVFFEGLRDGRDKLLTDNTDERCGTEEITPLRDDERGRN